MNANSPLAWITLDRMLPLTRAIDQAVAAGMRRHQIPTSWCYAWRRIESAADSAIGHHTGF
jgi:hypothetical protein